MGKKEFREVTRSKAHSFTEYIFSDQCPLKAGYSAMCQVYKKQSRADQASGSSGSKRELEVREQMVIMQ